METLEMFAHIDHTLLKAVATWEMVEKLCGEALEYKTASVCIPPRFVKRVREAYPDLAICTVIGFPLGYNTTEIKVAEARAAIRDGADEVDVVVNLGDVKDGDYKAVLRELQELREAASGKILKVIVEACYLTQEEKIRLCQVVTEAEADYIKTSTGFGAGGATVEDVRLFQRHIGPKVKIKAAGGIRSAEDLSRFLQLGCDRIGTSAAVQLLAEGGQSGGY